MLATERIEQVFQRGVLFEPHRLSDHPEAPAALPDESLNFLLMMARAVEAKTIFEFGSGRSTVALLSAGFDVVSLEDSAYWLDETMRLIAKSPAHHQALVRPLSVVWRNATPFLDWRLDEQLAGLIRTADIVLIDSPYYPPFRESTLLSVLALAMRTLVVLDDTRIPTLSRFCDRIALRNPWLLHRRVQVGHSFDVFCNVGRLRIDGRRSLTETAKAWRRFLAGKRILAQGGTTPAEP